jgi:excisionase family DNA binding protein
MEYFSVPQVMRITHASRRTLHTWAAEGRLEIERHGRRFRVSRASLKRVLADPELW